MDLNLNEVLIETAKDGNLLVLKRCIEKGADVNAKDDKGVTALMRARNKGHKDIVDLLIVNGAR